MALCICLVVYLMGYFLLDNNNVTQKPSIDYRDHSIELLYSECVTLSKDMNDPDYIACKNEYIKKCKDAGIWIISEQYAKHSSFSIINDLVKEEIINRLNDYDFYELVANASYYKGSEYQDAIIGHIEEVSLDLGPIARSLVYKLNMDDAFESVVLDDIDEMEDRTNLQICRKLVDCYKGTSLSNAVKEKFIFRITCEFEALSWNYLTDISKNTSGLDAVIMQDLANAYGDMFEGLLDWNNLINNTTRGMEGARTKFLEKWEENVRRREYNDIFKKSIIIANKKHEKSLNLVLKQIDCDSVKLDVPCAYLEFTPNPEVRDNTIKSKSKSGISDVIFRTLEIITIPIKSKANWMIFLGLSALEVGVNMFFDDPKEYFITEQFIHIENQLTKESEKCYKKIQEKDKSIIKQIESSL